jgi:hypothetical protein
LIVRTGFVKVQNSMWKNDKKCLFSFIPQNSNLLCHELENQVHETHGVCVSHIFTHMKFKMFVRFAVNTLASLLTKFFIFASSLISDIHSVWIKTNEDIFL